VKLCDKKLGEQESIPLLRVLTKSRFQHAKEISENFGAVCALRQAIDATPGLEWSDLVKKRVHVYIPGDGRRPYTAAAVTLTTPGTWSVWSIDPLMMAEFCQDESAPQKKKNGGKKNPLGGMSKRLTCVRGISEDFDIPQSPCDLSIVLAVHSHCPLSELFERIPTPRLCISMPCCGQCGLLDGEPVLTYYDEDILSPSRKVICHFHPSLSPLSKPAADAGPSPPLLEKECQTHPSSAASPSAISSILTAPI